MKRSSTIFLRAVILLMGLLVFTLCIFALPAIYQGWSVEYPEVAYMRFPVLIGIVASAISFLFALYQAILLLGYVDHDTAFSKLSILALKKIKLSALAISFVYLLGLPLIYHVAQEEDAPGLVVIGMFFCFAPFVIAVFAAVVHKLLISAIEMKSEHDLTV